MADHHFVKTYFAHPTWCNYCKEFLWGVAKKQGYRCAVCKGVAHGKCRTAAGHCLGLGSMQDITSDRPPQPKDLEKPKDTSNHNTNQKSTATVEPPAQTKGAERFAKAAYDFPPENERELELKKGDVVEVLQEVDEWWFGVLPDGREGYFPANYVEKIGAW